jgi:hypothetical protein
MSWSDVVFRSCSASERRCLDDRSAAGGRLSPSRSRNGAADQRAVVIEADMASRMLPYLVLIGRATTVAVHSGRERSHADTDGQSTAAQTCAGHRLARWRPCPIWLWEQEVAPATDVLPRSCADHLPQATAGQRLAGTGSADRSPHTAAQSPPGAGGARSAASPAASLRPPPPSTGPRHRPSAHWSCCTPVLDQLPTTGLPLDAWLKRPRAVIGPAVPGRPIRSLVTEDRSAAGSATGTLASHSTPRPKASR